MFRLGSGIINRNRLFGCFSLCRGFVPGRRGERPDPLWGLPARAQAPPDLAQGTARTVTACTRGVEGAPLKRANERSDKSEFIAQTNP